MKQHKQLAALLVLVGVLALAWFWNRQQMPKAVNAGQTVANYPVMNVDNPNIRWDKINRVQSTEYKPSGRNPFSDAPPPPPPQRAPQPGEKGYVQPPPPPPPAPPELPMKFFGYGTVPNGSARRAFLSDGDEVYIVAEGDTLLGRYRILKIGNATIEFEEISSGRQGRANIEDAGPNA